MSVAHVFKKSEYCGDLVASPTETLFTYKPRWIDDGREQVASTLPVTPEPVVRPPRSLPAFFANLLPEGRRLITLIDRVKTSADDEFGLLNAVGADTIGDVTVVPADEPTEQLADEVQLPLSPNEFSFEEILEKDLLSDASLPGVQDKISGRMISLSAVRTDEEFILKLSPDRYPCVVENEHYFVELARQCGLRAVDTEIIADRDGRTGLLVKRFDRATVNDEQIRLHVEDGCQTSERWPAEKYMIGFEQIAESMARLCDAPQVAMLELYRQWLFALVTCNGDQHAKNFSILEGLDGETRVSPAYDLPCTAFYGDKTLALTALGKKDGFSRNQVLTLGESLGLPERVCSSVLDRILTGTADMIGEIEDGAIPLDTTRTQTAVKLLRNRRRMLGG